VADQERIQSERETRARTQFLKTRSLFTSLQSKAPVLECFADANNEFCLNTLRENLQKLQQILDNTESQAAILNAEQIRVALLFSQKVRDDADMPEGFVGQSDNTFSPSPAIDSMDQTALMTYARSLINRTYILSSSVKSSKSDIAKIQKQIAEDMAKGARVLKGEPTSDDIEDGEDRLRGEGIVYDPNALRKKPVIEPVIKLDLDGKACPAPSY
jgi:hypothetical protein